MPWGRGGAREKREAEEPKAPEFDIAGALIGAARRADLDGAANMFLQESVQRRDFRLGEVLELKDGSFLIRKPK